MTEVLWFLFGLYVAVWLVRNERREFNNRKFDEAWTRYRHPSNPKPPVKDQE